MSSSKRSSSNERDGQKKSKLNHKVAFIRRLLKSGIFWDVENIPVKKAHAAKRIPEIKAALTHFVKNINHYNEHRPASKEIHKFVVVARQKGNESHATTPDVVKTHILQNEIELLDLPFSKDSDYCDDAIHEAVVEFTEEHSHSMVVAMTGDVGLVRRINIIEQDFDLVVIMQRAGKTIAVMERHCERIKGTNERCRQQAVYFMDEVVRKCANGSIPLTFSQLLRLKRSRNPEDCELDDNHFDLLFPNTE